MRGRPTRPAETLPPARSMAPLPLVLGALNSGFLRSPSSGPRSLLSPEVSVPVDHQASPSTRGHLNTTVSPWSPSVSSYVHSRWRYPPPTVPRHLLAAPWDSMGVFWAASVCPAPPRLWHPAVEGRGDADQGRARPAAAPPCCPLLSLTALLCGTLSLSPPRALGPPALVLGSLQHSRPRSRPSAKPLPDQSAAGKRPLRRDPSLHSRRRPEGHGILPLL
ncbi:hypothetical protein NDU88_005682 [Pleurodeles waltl]|uniref:Uncharacterized protein n=1 Tax=Pleurodeles waltl TaxID=8319 RepID=A0AAV7TB59_PLEWA|nr:hypothetical protein NDU88_005682 [Pleurodeles waltl]